MTGLLTFAAVIATIVLMISASRTGATATPGDPNRRGSWGIARWHSQRNRPLNPHERRWQTVLLAGKDHDARWADAVAEIRALEQLRGLDPVASAPDSYDQGWIEERLLHLEQSMNDAMSPGEPSR